MQGQRMTRETQKENFQNEVSKEREEIIFKNSQWHKSRRRRKIKRARSFREIKGKLKIYGQQTKRDVGTKFEKRGD